MYRSLALGARNRLVQRNSCVGFCVNSRHLTPEPENVPLTVEEHECILPGAWQVEAKGGRSQLSLLLKGSKDKSVLKHWLDQSPVYGKLSYLTIEEIENRIDQLIRSAELRTEFLGDFPLIVLTDQSWLRIQPWAHEYECHVAASADARRLTESLTIGAIADAMNNINCSKR